MPIADYPTLCRCFELIAAVSPQHARPAPAVEFDARTPDAWQQNNVLPYLASAEAELAALPPDTLRTACVSEIGTVPLSHETEEVLETLADCVFGDRFVR